MGPKGYTGMIGGSSLGAVVRNFVFEQGFFLQ